MAISKTVTKNAYGKELQFEDAYIRVEKVSGTKAMLYCDVCFYVNNGGDCFDEIRVSFEPAMVNKNFITQAYEYLKTIPEFVGSTDV